MARMQNKNHSFFFPYIYTSEKKKKPTRNTVAIHYFGIKTQARFLAIPKQREEGMAKWVNILKYQDFKDKF
jgi:hypothetical protein